MRIPWTTLALLLVLPRLTFVACTGANPNDWTPDDSALNACLSGGGTVSLDPGSPGYIVNEGLILAQDYTVLTSSSGTATIIAGYDLAVSMLFANANGFVIDNINFDGRGDTPGARGLRGSCGGGTGSANLDLYGDAITVQHSQIHHALCGQGMALHGYSMTIYDNYVAYNGDDHYSGVGGDSWADGITAASCYGCEMSENVFVDNTDIDLVVDGYNTSVHDNIIWHGGKYAWAGLNPGNFSGGDHTGSSYYYNEIVDSVGGTLGIGLLIGSHPWDSAVNQDYVTVDSNTVTGAFQNMTIEGAYNISSVSGNSMSSPAGSSVFSCNISENYARNASHSSGSIQGGWTQLTFDDYYCSY